ncbi:MAG: hydrolase, partial [Flavobacteriaceae bacterium]
NLENGIPSNNNSMIALQQKVFSRSNISAFIINRESSESENTDYEKYNRVIGVDYNLASADNTYVGKFYTHKSLSPGDTDGNLSVGTNLQYNTRTWSGFLDAIYIDEEFVSDLGFIPRKGILKWGGKIGYRIWPKKGIFNSHSFDTFQTYTHLSSLDYTQTDYLRNFGYEGRLNNQGQIELSINNRYTFLTDEFSPTRQDDATPLPANSEYDYTSIRFQFQSDRRKLFSYNIQTDIGEFFNGTKSSFETRLSFRVQPKLNVGLNSNIDRIDLPEDFGNATIVLISPRIDYTFNRSLFWSTLIQYSNQRDNLGINSRLQWRFAPLSDLFLVYNDNYFVNQWGPRSRSINLKLTYWLNI